MRGLNSLTRQLHAVKDRRALFSGVYAMAFYSGVTDLQSGGYHDPKWTRALMISHANAYRRMILSELRSDRSRISRAWRYALEFTERSRKWPQGFAGRSSADNPKHRWSADLDLVYSTHAHIMGDLVHALLQTPTEFGSRRLQADYERITESLHSAMPQIWAYYKSHPGSTSVSEKLSQKIIGGWIANLRTDAWEAAATMSEMEPRKRAKALGRLDAHVARRSANKGILLPILNHKH